MVISAPRFNGTYYLGAVFVFDNQDPPMNLNIMLEGRQVSFLGNHSHLAIIFMYAINFYIIA